MTAESSAPIKVTESSIADALKGSTMQTTQSGVSLPAVQRYVSLLEQGSSAPPIKIANGNIIVDGNHRYVAGMVFGQEPSSVPGTISSSQLFKVQPIQNIKVSPADWGNH